MTSAVRYLRCSAHAAAIAAELLGEELDAAERAGCAPEALEHLRRVRAHLTAIAKTPEPAPGQPLTLEAIAGENFP